MVLKSGTCDSILRVLLCVGASGGLSAPRAGYKMSERRFRLCLCGFARFMPGHQLRLVIQMVMMNVPAAMAHESNRKYITEAAAWRAA